MLSSVDVQRTFERAVAEHRAGRLPQAGQLYGEVLRREPQHEQASFLAAAIALEHANDLPAPTVGAPGQERDESALITDDHALGLAAAEHGRKGGLGGIAGCPL